MVQFFGKRPLTDADPRPLDAPVVDPLELLTPWRLAMSLASARCLACAEPKEPGCTFCGGCYAALPQTSRGPLWEPADRAYAAHVRSCLITLAKTPHFAHADVPRGLSVSPGCLTPDLARWILLCRVCPSCALEKRGGFFFCPTCAAMCGRKLDQVLYDRAGAAMFVEHVAAACSRLALSRLRYPERS